MQQYMQHLNEVDEVQAMTKDLEAIIEDDTTPEEER